MIKGISATFKSNCKKDKVKLREYIIIDNKQVDIKGKLSATAYKNSTFFGTFNMKMLKFETENDINYKKKEFVYYKEVDGEAIKIGTFIVTDVTDSDTFESVNVTAYDYGLKLANPYTTKLDYSSGKITLLQQIKEICTNCDIELENTSLPNGTFIVDSNQFVNGEQYGDVIAQASGINGMFATINSNDKLEFIFQNETDEIIEDYVELDDKRDTHPITSVLVATSEDLETAGAVMKDENLIAQYGEHWLKIYSYGYAYSTKKCQDLVNAIFNQVKGFGYSSFKSKYSFLPYLSLGDKIQFRNKEGNLVNSIILKYETDYDEITFDAPSIINASVEYELPETPENIAKKAMITVNQSVGEIRGEVTKVESKVEDITTTTQTSTGGNSLYLKESLESNALEYSVDGRCEQETSVQSKNLLDLSKFEKGRLDNGVIGYKDGTNSFSYTDESITVITNANYRGVVSDYVKVNASTDYYLHFSSQTTGTLYTIDTFDGNKNWIQRLSNSWDGNVNSFTTTTTTAYVRIGLSNSSSGTFTVSKLQVAKKPYTEFSPFVPSSPSPDYPSEIKTIKGIRNLLNLNAPTSTTNGITCTNNNDGSITINGHTTAGFAYYLTNDNITFEKGKKYTISAKILSGSCTNYISSTSWAFRFIADKNNSNTTFADIGSTTKEVEKTFDGTNSSAKPYLWFGWNSSTTENDAVFNDLRVQFMVEEGSIAHPYIPYGAWAKVKITGKNLFDGKLEQGGFNNSTGAKVSNTALVRNVNPIYLNTNESYIFSNNGIGIIINVLEYKADGTFIKRTNVSASSTFVTDSETKYINFYRGSSDTDNIQLEQVKEGQTEPTDYEPYKEKEVLIDLAKENSDDSYELNSIGDTKDKLEIVNGVAVIQKRIGKIVLNGSENWSLHSSGNFYSTNNILSNAKTPTTITEMPYISSTHFKTDTYKNVWQNITDNTITISNDGANNPRISFDSCKTVADFKSWLKANPVTVYYILNEPETITLPNTNIPLYEGVNHVTLVEDLETTTSIKYLRKTPISGEYALNQDLNKTNSNLADTNNQLSQTQSDIDETKTNLNNNYYNKEQVDSINSTTTQNITQIRNTMEQNITSTNASISKIQEEITNGVSKVTTTTGTFDENGLNISKSGQQMSSTLDWDGLEVVRDKRKATETEVLTVRSAGVEAENMTVRKFLIKKPIRIEKCKSITDSTKVGLGFFWIGE